MKWLDNDALKKSLEGWEAVIDRMDDGLDLDDDQSVTVSRFRSLPPVERMIYYLWVKEGATRTASLLGVSRQFIYKKCTQIQGKITR